MGPERKQKRARKEALKNRYFAGAKLSEHKFLRILRGYAEGMTIAELAPTTQTSAKTIRTIYRALRERLTLAILAEPDRFGGAGKLHAIHCANNLLESVRRSPHYRRHRKRHAPRLSCPIESRHLLIEVMVRLLCALDLRCVDIDDDVIEVWAEAITRLRARKPLQGLAVLIPGAKPHAHSALRLYEDYRRYLLQNPLGTRWI